MNVSIETLKTLNLKIAGHNFLIKGMDSIDVMSEYCIVYVAKGTQLFRIPGRGDIPAPAGTFMIYPPGEHYRSYLGNDVGENYWIIFDGFENEIFHLLDLKPYTLYTSEPSTAVSEYFDKIIEELLFKEKHHKIMAQTLFMQLLLLLWRSCNEASMVTKNLTQIQKSHSISMAIYMMKSQCQKNYTLDEYAKMCNLSSYRFSHKFKEKMGISPMVYRKLCRLKKTQVLMRKHPSWSISEIAESVGFESTSYFCSAFKEYFNITPSEYKNAHEKQNSTHKKQDN